MPEDEDMCRALELEEAISKIFKGERLIVVVNVLLSLLSTAVKSIADAENPHDTISRIANNLRARLEKRASAHPLQ